jgi:acyl transferase domain-containing protein/NADPH:quinone reductase-like Zn-dependent oxidoreductase/SAM-dependent methyltransferase/acyl carrier protein
MSGPSSTHRDQIDESATTAGEPIAIVGIGCRFPGGADSPRSFWRLLENGIDAISEVPADRWSLGFFVDPNPSSPGRMYSRCGGFLAGIDNFDAAFFGLAPREAATMDPQQRLLLEVCWEALEDAGQVPEELSGSKTGVFIGISTHDYSDIQLRDLYSADFYANTGGALSIAANRISYLLNFRGPSLAVDTACSSSLVAIHLACRSIWQRESRLAIAGGVNCVLTPETSVTFSKGSMLSPDGRCKAFDARANGYVRGEGAGAIVLKPLSEAQADGDQIYAVILATAVNQDGRTHGMTVPSRAAQEALLRTVYQQADVPLDRVLYVEAHGTGTPVGDPIEAGAIGSVLGSGRPLDRCLRIGSVKSNIGHLEAASGIAGLIKAAMVLKQRRIPPSLHFQEPNPRIAFEDLRLQVQQRSEPFPSDDQRAVAGVNSFGFGGTNAHVVLQEAPFQSAVPKESTATPQRMQLVPVSGRSPEALLSAARNLALFLNDADTGGSTRFDDICRAASVRRSHFEHRAAFVAGSHEELASGLRSFIAAKESNGTSQLHSSARARKLAFVFSGMGPQWWGMGRGLLKSEPVFRSAVERCDELFRRIAGWSILDELLADEAQSRMAEAAVAQPAGFLIQMGLADLWASWGVVPDAIVGHSAGEVAAAAVAGALSLEDAVRVIFHRSRLQQRAAWTGRMLAVGLNAAEARAALAEFDPIVSIAAINAPSSITLSGDGEALAAISSELQRREVFSRFLDVNVPYHSHLMDPLEAELRESLLGLHTRTASVPLYSTVSGERADGQELDASYWWANIRQPVNFAAAIEQLIADDHDSFVEIAPHPVLSHAVLEGLSAQNTAGVVLPSLRREREWSTLLDSLGSLYVRGHSVNWRAFVLSDNTAAHTMFPTYPWQKERYWHESEQSSGHRLDDPIHPLLHRRLESPDPAWETNIGLTMPAYLKDHCIQGSVVYPAAAYIEMAVAAARELECEQPVLEDIDLKRALAVGKDAVQQLRLTVDAQQSGFTIHSRPRESGQAWVLHATGNMRLKPGAAAGAPASLDRIRRRCRAELTGEYCYRLMDARGLQYGAHFQGLAEMWQGKEEAVGRIVCPEPLLRDLGNYHFHPAVLDACFHVLMGTIFLDAGGKVRSGTYIPVHIGRIRVHNNPPGEALWSHATLTNHNATSLTGDLCVFDAEGRIIIEITSFKCQHIPGARSNDDWRRHLYDTQWYAKALPGPRTGGREYVASPSQIALTVPQPAEVSTRFGRARHYNEVEPQLERLCAAYVVEAFAELGWTPRRGESVEVSTLMARLGIQPQHRKLLARLLEILCEDGVLTATASGWAVRRAPKFADSVSTFASLNTAYPEYQAVLKLLAACGPHLAGVLKGEQEPLQLIFPDGSMTMLREGYQESPYQRAYNYLAQQAVAAVIRDLPPNRTLRILEIGAGTGATTAHVLSVLPPNRTEYVFTDVSNAFVTAAQRQFSDYPFVQYQVLDIERSPEEQGFTPHSFDLVLAADVLHATRDLHETLANVSRLIASEGLLVLLEIVRPSRVLDLIFGLLKDWWRFEDVAVRGDHPWLSSTSWQHCLSESGFSEITSLADAEEPGNPFQTVFVARGPRVSETAALSVETSATPRAQGHWLILADQGGVGEQVAASLQARGAVPIIASVGTAYATRSPGHVEVRPENADDMTALVASAGSDLRGIVHLWSLDIPVLDDAGAAGLESAQRLGCISALNLIQAVAKSGRADQPRIWLTTCGAQQVTAEDALAAVAQAPLWGLGRVIANEHPHVQCTLLDLDPDAGVSMSALLERELFADDPEQEVAVRGHSRYVPRINGPIQSLTTVSRTSAARTGRSVPFSVEASRPGVLDSLILRETKRRKPGPDEVEIQVCAAGLNFRDVMKAMGLYPTDGEEVMWLGDECAGRIVKVGASVKGLRVGDEVVAVAPGTLRSFVTIPATQALKKPAHLSFEEAATIPIVFLTVLYALKHLSVLSRGERILIHAAAGGIGLAAIQIAQHAGAEIFATAGNPEKREYVRSLGVRHVMDSRSQAFADEVRAITRGKGVAVVLNSLAGDFIPNSLALVEPAGRFIELGKIDIYQDSKLGLAHFKSGLSFFAVDLGWLLQHRPQLANSLLHEVMALFEAGTLRPLPVTTFPISDVAGAFRHMAQAKHIGKIALSFPQTGTDAAQTSVEPSEQRTPLFSRNATYLVTGGLSGFGLSIAQWLVRQGARHLVLVGRSGLTNADAEASVGRMRDAGAQVTIASVDVTQGDRVADLIGEISSTMPPLRGVFHAAMVLDDGYLMQLNEARFARVTAPKVTGTWNLHQATLDSQLDYFVLFSSVSSMTGQPGQGNYCAANAFLDAFAHYRRAKRLPALTVNWGALGDVGYVSRNADIGRYLERQGLEGLKASEAEAILEELLRGDRCQVAAVRVDFKKLATALPAAQAARRFSHVLRTDALDGQSTSARQEQGAVLNKIRAAAAPERAAMLQVALRDALANVLKISGERIDADQAFGGLGLDSLMAVELEARVKSDLGIDLSLGFLAGGEITLRRLTERVLDQVMAPQAA